MAQGTDRGAYVARRTDAPMWCTAGKPSAIGGKALVNTQEEEAGRYGRIKPVGERYLAAG
ncbi:hypothetical protein GCM10010307_35450 [Streptomyces vastus]|uniref:Uncharacterized protein n=1 Tax=Streptomyces vastus TaxID=285451 RepID=A0ABP6DA65_9ACTN